MISLKTFMLDSLMTLTYMQCFHVSGIFQLRVHMISDHIQSVTITTNDVQYNVIRNHR